MSCELCQRNKNIDHVPPRPECMMHGKHRRRDRRGRTAVAVAAVYDTRPGRDAPKTILTRMTIAKEQAVCAQQAVVVQRLNHSATLVLARSIRRRGDTR